MPTPMGSEAGVTSGALQIYSLQKCTIRIVIAAIKSAGIISQGWGRFTPKKNKYPTPPPRNSLFFLSPYVNKCMQINKLMKMPHVSTSKQRPLKHGPFSQITPLKGPKLPENSRFLDPVYEGFLDRRTAANVYGVSCLADSSNIAWSRFPVLRSLSSKSLAFEQIEKLNQKNQNHGHFKKESATLVELLNHVVI